MTQIAFFLLSVFMLITGIPSISANNTIPSTISIEDLVFFDQSDVLSAIGVIKSASGTLPVRVYPNYVPVVFQNNTGLPASDIYLTFHGTSVANPNGVQFIQFDTATALGSFVPGADNLLSANYSVQLSSMPQITSYPDGYYLFYVPLTNSGRAYVTIGQPMYLYVNTSSPYSVNDPSPTLYTDSNYYTIYDFYEFTFNQSGQSNPKYLAWEANFNTSAVDFFGISSELQFLSYPSMDLLLVGDPTQVNCGPTTFSQSRTSILNSLSRSLTTTNNSTYWSALLLPFLSNPYSATSTVTTYLRVMNPGFSIVSPPSAYNMGGGAVAFPQNAYPGFPADYLQDAATYGQNYVDLWMGSYTGSTMLNLTLDVLSLPYPLYTGVTTGSSGSYTLTLTSSNGAPTETLTEADLIAGNASSAFFTGTGFPITPSGGDVAQISEYFGGAFETGLWGLSNISQSTLRANSANYYKNPSFVSASSGPWFDLYASILHQLALVPSYAEVKDFGAVYASPYDDLLGINSSLANKNPTDITLTPSPYINVTLNTIGTVPSIADSGSYQVTFALVPGGSSLSYRTGGSGSYTSYSSGAITVNSFPLQVAYVSGNSPTVTRYYTINLLYQNMQPTVVSGNQYTVTDQGIINTTTIIPDSTTPTAFTITFNQ